MVENWLALGRHGDCACYYLGQASIVLPAAPKYNITQTQHAVFDPPRAGRDSSRRKPSHLFTPLEMDNHVSNRSRQDGPLL